MNQIAEPDQYLLFIAEKYYNKLDDLKTFNFKANSHLSPTVLQNLLNVLESDLNSTSVTSKAFTHLMFTKAIKHLEDNKDHSEKIVGELVNIVNQCESPNVVSKTLNLKFTECDQNLKKIIHEMNVAIITSEIDPQGFLELIVEGKNRIDELLSVFDEILLSCIFTTDDLCLVAKTLVDYIGEVCSPEVREIAQKLPELEEILNNLVGPETLGRLWERCLVIEKQPPAIIKKKTEKTPGTQFSASVRFLLPSEKFRGTVKAYYVSEPGLRSYHQFGNVALSESILLENGEVKMDDRDNNCCVFKDLLLKIPKGTGGPSNEKVAFEKGAILFEATLSLNFPFGEEYKNLPRSVLSNMVVPIVHTNQEWSASGVLWWDNAFPLANRTAYDTLPSVSWQEFQEKFLKPYFEHHIKKPPNEAQLHFIYRRLFPEPEVGNEEVIFRKIMRDTVAPLKVPFWRWIYETVKLITFHLSAMWENDLIEGFISKEDALECLLHQSTGTFLLRFSETVSGTITVTKLNADNEIESWRPFKASEMKSKHLAEHLMEFNQIDYLFTRQNIFRKQDVLRRYLPRTQTTEEPLGYVPRGLCLVPQAMLEEETVDDMDPMELDLAVEDISEFLHGTESN